MMAVRTFRLQQSFRVLLVAASVLLLGLVVVSFLLRPENKRPSRNPQGIPSSNALPPDSSPNSPCVGTALSSDYPKEREQRNTLSHLANQLKRDLGQTECRLIELQKQLGHQDAGRVASSGGWCYQDSRTDSVEHKFDESLADALSTLFRDQHVGSLGEGPGLYKRHLLKVGQVRSYHAYDGAPFIEESTQGEVTFLDLTVPQYDLPAFDWVLCLEVAEHIPRQFEAVFLDNVVRHARKGVVLSWAKPLQDGLEHVNNKAAEEVVQLLYERGFQLDPDASFALKRVSTFFWLQDNVNVYMRINPESFDKTDA